MGLAPGGDAEKFTKVIIHKCDMVPERRCSAKIISWFFGRSFLDSKRDFMSEMRRHLILTGLMGSGKSTIGQLLGEQVALEFVDTDELVVERKGCSIPQIFEREGEEAFREAETAVLSDVLAGKSCVVATGGGIVTREENRRILQECGGVVYLRAGVECLYARIHGDANRPLLVGGKGQLEKLLEARVLFYEEADFIVDVEDVSPEAVVKKIVEWWNKEGGRDGGLRVG